MVHFKITDKMCQELKNHLHNGDGLEALAFVLCGRLNHENNNWLLAHEIFPMPYEKCERDFDHVSWKTEPIEHLLEKAKNKGFAIVKVHSHFKLNSDFSELDDISDKSFFEAVYGWSNSDLPHASVVMYPDGSMKGRTIESDMSFKTIPKITVLGSSINQFQNNDLKDRAIGKEFIRNQQTFGKKTTQILLDLKVGVVGCSGTGSPVIEQLVRLGVGIIVLVDDDNVEHNNLNRIIGSTISDADIGKLKVNAIKDHIERIGLNTKVITFPKKIQESREALDSLASCDFIFGCVDSIEGRFYLNLISTYYLVPLIDIGVKLVADGDGGIDSINGNIHYINPGSETLLERKVFTQEQLTAESLKRISPQEYKKRKAYFDNLDVESPAVISVNMTFAAFAVNEMLGRFHHYRYSDNTKFSQTCINLSDWDINTKTVNETKSKSARGYVGIGNLEPEMEIYVSKTAV
ncbi:HesA/MoeB/ThiF family protein [Arenibacter palladensis]|uniref:HesA/MoeB/ThiF family protein n=1 Tax=Arenibacter palladensis TaxID=237373 RepID=UPI0026E1ACF8|nr:ThiF family adenylyltransferase [Arenibacter palladensis]MDO6601656.1 ThiF family adenylyltransferase [Arenibacter palladensis]